MSGFTVQLDEAQKAADVHLPAAADHIREPMGVLRAHEGFGGSEGGASTKAQRAYAGVTDYLAGHLEKGAQVTEGIAQALRDILDLYRRADGQDR